MLTLLFAGLSFSATRSVPGDYPTVEAAVRAAATGDVIVLAEGSFAWDPARSSFVDLHLRGSGRATQLQLASAISSEGSVKIEDMSVDGSLGVVQQGDIVSLARVQTASSGLATGGGRLFLSDVDVRSVASSRALISGTWRQVMIDGLVVSDSEFDEGVLRFFGVSEGVIASRMRILSTRTRRAVVEVPSGTIRIQDSAFLCGSSLGQVIGASDAQLEGVAIWSWETNDGALVTVANLESAQFLTLGSNGRGAFLESNDLGVLRDVVFAGSAAAPPSARLSARLRHLPGTRSPPAGSVEVEPEFWGSADPSDCTNVTLYPDRGSPLIDAGDPSVRDRDGTPSDIGATGGPNGLILDPDADLDRCPSTFDCDDADRTRRPGNDDAWYDGLDADCDGSDDFDQDGDGFQHGSTDCDDAEPAVFPGAADPCGDGLDGDCDGFDGVDCDGDGFASLDQGGSDCDDEDDDVHPGLAEDVHPRDRDCDGIRDPASPLTPRTCASSGGPSAWLLLPLILIVLRRSRHLREPAREKTSLHAVSG